jgi:hypothetical protein
LNQRSPETGIVASITAAPRAAMMRARSSIPWRPDTKGQWICWVLSKNDIDVAAKRAGVKSKKLTEDDYEAIARTFIKGLEWANEAWADILEDAIKEIMR